MTIKMEPPGGQNPDLSAKNDQSHNAQADQGRNVAGHLVWARPLILILLIGLTVLILWMGGQIQQLGRYGYPGIFLLNLLANATVILPLPGVVVTSAFGAVLNPFWVSIAAGTGAALGELSGYFAGTAAGGQCWNGLKITRGTNRCLPGMAMGSFWCWLFFPILRSTWQGSQRGLWACRCDDF